MFSSTGVPTSSERNDSPQPAPAVNAELWIAVLGGAALWLFHFEALFALAPWACVFQRKAALYGISVAAFLLIMANAAFSFRLWQRFGREWAGDAGGPLPRARIMAIAGVFLNLGFATVVVAQSLSEFILGACE